MRSDGARLPGAYSRTPVVGENGRYGLVGQFRQFVFGRLGGYDDVNDADRLSLDPVMRWIVGGHAVTKQAASTSQMGRFETEVMATDANVEALADLSGQWIDTVHDRHPPTKIILDMDSSVSPTHGDQERTAYNGHFGCTCYHPLFLFNLAVRRTMCGVITPVSAIRPEAGTGNGAWWPRWNGILGSWFPVSALIRFAAQASPTCRAPPSGWLLSTISGAKRSNTSRKARTRSNGRGCRADGTVAKNLGPD